MGKLPGHVGLKSFGSRPRFCFVVLGAQLAPLPRTLMIFLDGDKDASSTSRGPQKRRLGGLEAQEKSFLREGCVSGEQFLGSVFSEELYEAPRARSDHTGFATGSGMPAVARRN